MNKKGFTLIELVTVIALLGVISLIAFVSIFKVIEKNKVSNCETLLLNIKSAAKDYASDNRYGMFNTNITAQELINDNYLSGNIKDPFSNNNGDLRADDINITISLNSDYTVNNVDVEYKDGGTYHPVNCNNKKW